MPKVKKECAVCGGHFEVWGDRENTAVTCSRVCSGKWQAMGYAVARATVECAICKTSFSVPPSHKNRRKCCSRECSAKLDSMRDHVTGEDSCNWKGGKAAQSDGYLYMTAEGHPFASHAKYVLEHRLVMEQWMREEAPDHKFLVEVDGEKFLSPDIAVHHVDEDKRNNSRGNLVACTQSAHQCFHSGKPPTAGEAWPEPEVTAKYMPLQVTCKCAVCGTKFKKKRSDVQRGNGKFYCSRACYKNRPTQIF